jgi:hypothetical protein
MGLSRMGGSSTPSASIIPNLKQIRDPLNPNCPAYTPSRAATHHLSSGYSMCFRPRSSPPRGVLRRLWLRVRLPPLLFCGTSPVINAAASLRTPLSTPVMNAGASLRTCQSTPVMKPGASVRVMVLIRRLWMREASPMRWCASPPVMSRCLSLSPRSMYAIIMA